MTLATLYFINTVASCLGRSIPMLSFLGGMSLLPTLFLVMSSLVFQFCPCHRMYLYYCVAVDAINYMDMKVGLSLKGLQLLGLHCMGAFLFLTAILIVHMKLKRDEEDIATAT